MDRGLPARWGRCFQGGFSVESSIVTQQSRQPDISRRSISSTMNQSRERLTKQPLSKASRAWAGTEPRFFSLCCFSCLGLKLDGFSLPPRAGQQRWWLSKMLQPEHFAGENADKGGDNIWQMILLLLLFYCCLMVGV